MAQVRVVAFQDGHDGVQYHPAGSVFYVDGDKLKDDGTAADGSTWYGTPENAPDEQPAPDSDKATKRPPGAGPAKGSKAK